MVDDAELGVGKTCFVVGPIGDRFKPLGHQRRAVYDRGVILWEQVFQPVCERFGLTAVRADKIARSGEITEQIVEFLRDSDLVIADLTGGNANVMYELGLRHSVALPTVLVGEVEVLPFDVNTLRTVQFEYTEGGRIGLRDDLVDFVREALVDGGGSPIATRVLQSRESVTGQEVGEAATLSATPEPDVGEAEEPGVMDILAEGQTALESVTEILNDARVSIDEIGEVTQAHTDKMTASDKAGKGFVGRLAVARALAQNLKEPADVLSAHARKFEDAVGLADAMVQYVFRELKSDEGARTEVLPTTISILGLADAAEESLSGITRMLRATGGLRKISRDLRPSSSELEAALTRLVVATKVIVAWRDAVFEAYGGDPRPDESDEA